MKKSVAIIGGGVSGMIAGIYLLDNGFDVTIYEKHVITGGQCTAWSRKGVLIDGCAHWIVGTNPKSDLYPLWKHVGAIRDDSQIFETEYFSDFEINGQHVVIYADIDKLKAELLKVAPEDKKQINFFIKQIKAYRHVSVPAKRPLDWNNPFQWMALGFRMLPMAASYARCKKIALRDFAKRFKSPILQKLFTRIINPNFNLHALAYTLQALSMKDAGVIQGGSIKFTKNIEERFLSLGGVIKTNTEVNKVLIKNHHAVGVKISNNEEIKTDFVISACDMHHTLYDLLDNQYNSAFFNHRFDDRKKNPLIQSFSFAYSMPLKKAQTISKMNCFPCQGIKVGDFEFEYIAMRNHAFDESLNNSKTCITLLQDVPDKVYDYLKSLSHEEYLKEKNELGEKFRKALVDHFNLDDEDISLIDVASPLTYERYTNAYRGSYQAFCTTSYMGELMDKGIIKGLNNFYMCGQWIMPPGGLPVAAISGKIAAMRTTKAAKQKFIDKE